MTAVSVRGMGSQVGRIKEIPRVVSMIQTPLKTVILLQSPFGEMDIEYIACLGPAVLREQL